MLNVINPHLSTPVEKTVVYDFALPNPGENCKELRLRKVQHYLSSLKEEKTLAVFIPLTLLPKNHNLFANIKKDETEGGKKRKIRVHSLIMQKYNGGGGGDPTPDTTFKEVLAPTPDPTPNPVSDLTPLISASRELCMV